MMAKAPYKEHRKLSVPVCLANTRGICNCPVLRDHLFGFMLHEPIKLAFKGIIGPSRHYLGYAVSRKISEKVEKGLIFVHAATFVVCENAIDQDETFFDPIGEWHLYLL